MSGVLSRLTRKSDDTLVAWLPVALLPPVLVLDAALSPDAPPVTVLGVVAAFVACLPLVLRRRLGFALLGPLLTAGIVLVLWLLEPGNTVVLIAMVALVELAARGDRRRSIWTGLAVAPCVLVSVLPFGKDAGEVTELLVRNFPLCLLALAFGDILRSRREAEARLAASREEESQRRIGEERLRIAREVHDVVAHHMVAINVQAGVAAHMMDREPQQARTALRDIKATSGEALADLRATLGLLRGVHGAAPVGPAARLDDLDELTPGLRAAGADVRVDIGALDDVPGSVHAAGYRIVQEALTNALRHARPTAVGVTVAGDAHGVRIEVVNDGVSGADDRPAGNGVRGMQERAASLGGTLEAGPAPGATWRVAAHLPVRRAELQPVP